ncbi:hypothetical protein [Phycicoccus sp. SLBN-51]|uniref:hypothetical protein n=1 Tax=Phycicoccus sp. SLBN-51 TaxID=2768447 RepID=UPI001153EDB7|nr:hypothetical protein [Phycicoccus sp. SLBN-51]TQJ51834.1 hypothetical protein FBY26_3572 [Phycicoccus sp. SLBN-51]
MNRTIYLVDNNALIALTRRRVKTEFFAEHCRITADVLHEASEHSERRRLAALAEATTSAILEQVRVVMADVAVGDTALVDLYANKGAADPGLVATVLVSAAAQEGYLFPDHWVIVTLDRAVQDAAKRHGVTTMLPSELADLIDAATTLDGKNTGLL